MQAGRTVLLIVSLLVLVLVPALSSATVIICDTGICYTCDVPSDACLTCDSGTWLTGDPGVSGTVCVSTCVTDVKSGPASFSGHTDSCLSECPSAFWAGPNEVCAPCDTSCSTCSPTTGGCETCPAGYELSGTAGGSGTVCTPCPAGEYCIGGADPGALCEAGSYSAVGSSSCYECPEGTYSSAGAETCDSCPKGYTSPVGSISPTACVETAGIQDISVTETVVPVDDLAIDFGSVAVGASSTVTVTVGNTGSVYLSVDGVGAVNDLAAPFSVDNDSCTGATVTSTPCTFDIVFTPASVASYADSVDISSDDPDEDPVIMAVSGEGIEDTSGGSSGGGGGGGGACGILVTPGDEGGPSGPIQLLVLGLFLLMGRKWMLSASRK